MKAFQQDIQNTCKSHNFPPDKLGNLRSIFVDKVQISLQHPVEVNNTTAIAGSSRNSRNSGMDWIYNLPRKGNNLNRLSCINHGN